MPYLEAKTNGGKILKILMDTGSNKNYIQPSIVPNPKINIKPFFANSVGGTVKITHHTDINLFKLANANAKFYLMPNLSPFDALIGNDTLRQLRIDISNTNNYITVANNKKIKIKQYRFQSVNTIQIRNAHMNQEQSKEITKITTEFKNLFSEPNQQLTYTSRVKGEIRTNTDQPVYTKSYPYPMSLKDEIEKQIKELLSDGIIRPSRSPYNSPVWIVPKKIDASNQKKYRLVIDYRKLNSITIADKYPIPDINEVLAQLGENRFFSVIDLKSGFHQIPLREEDIEKTAFSINNGKYEFTRLPFGLKNSPSIFQRTLDDILRHHIGKICYVYIDDIVIFSKDEKSHYENVRKVFETLEQANMKVQLDKCEFLKKEAEFLGFIITENGIKTNPLKVKAIQDFPTPKTLKDLRSFLGLSGYYRRFVRDYAKLAKPLTNLLRGEDGRVSKTQSSKKIINFGDKETEAFEKIKKSLTSEEVVLAYPNFNHEFHLTTDASNHALGAVLEQNNRPIAFISRTLSKTEENYASNEKELLAIIWALNFFRNYLYGTATVKIFTDHQPLTYALSTKNSNSKMKRWKAILEEYNHQLIYKPGKTNVVADALSRPPQINTLTSTAHSDDSSSNFLIQFTDAPINAFKNQIFFKLGEETKYEFDIVFPTYHRHSITDTYFNQDNLLQLLKKYLNPSVINGIHSDERTLGQLQLIYPTHFKNYKVKFARKILIDLQDKNDQEAEIINEHKRAHRNSKENKVQLLEKYYFPKMQAKIDQIVKQCKICKTQKYERHPPKPNLMPTPLPQYAGQIIHIDIFYTNNKVLLTAIDKFSKYAQVRIIKSRAVQDIKDPLKDLLMSFGTPQHLVIDNEKSLTSAPITYMLENELNIKIFKVPPYCSKINGQIERFHSTFSEIMRCLKSEKIHNSFEDLIFKTIYTYNHSVHSVTKRKPVEAFFGRSVVTNAQLLQKEQDDIKKNLKEKQEADLNFHNKNKQQYKDYKAGQTIYVKTNKRIGNKLSPRYKEEIVAENRDYTVITQSQRTVHKSLIKN